MDTPAAVANASPAGGDEVADLITISFAKLEARDQDEEARLLEACTKWGFFYLDVGQAKPLGYLKAVDDLFELSKEYFARPLDEKKRDTPDDFDTFNICGYGKLYRKK